MSIAKMRKVTVIVHYSVLDQVIDALQSSGLLEIAPSTIDLPAIEIDSDDARVQKVENELAKAVRLRKILEPYHVNEQAMSLFVSEKTHLNTQEYQDSEWTSNYDELAAQCDTLVARLTAEGSYLEPEKGSTALSDRWLFPLTIFIKLVEEELRIEAEKELAALSEKWFASLTILIQKLESVLDALMIRTNFVQTEQTVIINSWIRRTSESELAEALEPYSSEIDLTFDDPSSEDDVPVALENPKWLQPFELLTDLYGRPTYTGIDPTPLLAPFFLLFFAICIGDVGYGLMLAGAFAVIRTYLDVAPGVKQFCRLMIYGGFASIPIGILTASYLALPFESLPLFMQNLRVIDQLTEITTFLVITMVLGAIQVVTGILIAAYRAIKGGKWQVAIGSQFSIFLLVGTVAVFFLTDMRYPWFLYGGLIATTLLQGFSLFHQADPAERTPKKALTSVLVGLYEVYGMTSVVNDILSYMRLAALALAGALVGMVFNRLAGLVWDPARELFATGGIGYVWAVLLCVIVVAIFLVGHVFNVTINLLGAFVHPLRLQFVEFFGRFYTAGGIAFEPFAWKRKDLVFDVDTTVDNMGGATSGATHKE